MHSRWARVARGWSAAAFATIVAAVSHTLAGGQAPSVFGLVVSLVLSATACTLLAGRTVSLLRLTVSIGLSQILFHALFSGLGSPVAAEHVHGTMTMLDVTPMPGHAGGMWLGHIAAGLVTIVAFRNAETAFWGLAGSARLALGRLLPVVPEAIVRWTQPRPLELTWIPRELREVLSTMRHRGPPLGFAAR
jgi:hypothetical protein